MAGATAPSKCHGYDPKKFKLTFDAESREMKLQFIVLLMNGNDREALRGVKPSRHRRETLVRPTRHRSDGFEVTTSR